MMVRHRADNTRKTELIEATLSCIAEQGLHKTTVRRIAEYAGVTNGLIRFYFAGKEVVIREAYRYFLQLLFDSAASAIRDTHDSATSRLTGFVIANLSAPIAAPRSLLLWANFLPLTFTNREMADIRREYYLEATLQFQTVIAAALIENERSFTQHELRQYAIKLNSLVDGLWLEAGQSDRGIRPRQLRQLGLSAAGTLLGLDLRSMSGAVDD